MSACTIANKVEAFPCWDNLTMPQKKTLMYYFIHRYIVGSGGSQSTPENALQEFKTLNETEIIKVIMVSLYEMAAATGTSVQTDPNTIFSISSSLYNILSKNPDIDKVLAYGICEMANA